MTKKKNIGISRALEYSPNPTKDLSPKLHYLAGYNQATEDHICSESHPIQETLITEIMVLREKNEELTSLLSKIVKGYNEADGEMWIPDHIGNYITQAESKT